MLSKRYRKLIISKKLLPELRDIEKYSLTLFFVYLIYFAGILNFCFINIYQIKLLIGLVTGVNLFLSSIFSILIMIFLYKQIVNKYIVEKIVSFEMNPFLVFALKKCFLDIAISLVIIATFWFSHGILSAIFSIVS